MNKNKSKKGFKMTTIYVNTDEELKDAINKYKNNKDIKIVIDFHKNKRQVRTASIEQVRNPINKKSIGAWKKYEDYLSEMLSELK